MISKRLENLSDSDIRSMTQKCLKYSGINMGQGLCDFKPPHNFIEHAQKSLEIFNKYGQPEGDQLLREVLSEKIKKKNNLDFDKNKEIVVTMGATGAYVSTLMALFNPGDSIVMFEPFYGYHKTSTELAGLNMRTCLIDLKNYTFKDEDLIKKIDKTTKAILLCNPGNPSGKVFTLAELKRIGKIAKQHNILIITDEIYEDFLFDGRKHISMASLKEYRDITISIMGFSKTYNLTGWRIGYVVADEKYARLIKKASDVFYICPSTPLQRACALSLNEIKANYYQKLAKKYQAKRDFFVPILREAGFNVSVPQGTYYILAELSHFKFKDSYDAAMTILKQVGVASIPGRSFFTGNHGENYLRFCLGLNDNLLKEAASRLLRFKD